MKLSSAEKFRLKSKYGDWAIVTGASSGIGLEIATQLADAKLNLILVSRNLDKLKEVQESIELSSNVTTIIVTADISKPSDLDKIINASLGLNIGLLVASAGYGTSGTSLTIQYMRKLICLK